MTTFVQGERLRASHWKDGTDVLPVAAKVPAGYVNKDGHVGQWVYPFCLPPAYADLNLLPEVRVRALLLFAELGIPWHAGVGGGPSNHLLSSQVQCANALTQMVDDPQRLIRAFGDAVNIAEVLPVEPGRFLTFEYIGPVDVLGEATGGVRRRGAYCTSVDAAFRHRANDGAEELVLVEWKYVESYGRRNPDPVKDAIRAARYQHFVEDPAGPVRGDVVAFSSLLDEPFYQLMRQQLLADQFEKLGIADRVRVVHVRPVANNGYEQSLHRPELQALGGAVSEVWQQLLRRNDRYQTLGSKAFLDPLITSEEYVARYV